MQISTSKKISKSSNTLTLIYINTTVKNTIITVTSEHNNDLILQESCKSHPKVKYQKANNTFTLKNVAKNVIQVVKKLRGKQVRIYTNGTGFGKFLIMRAISQQLQVIGIHDVTPTSFNGCRPKKQKRR